MLTTAALAGLAGSPVIAGFLGASGLRLVFVFDVLLLVALTAVVWARMRGLNLHQQAVSDTSASGADA